MKRQLRLAGLSLVLLALVTACGAAAPTATPTPLAKPAAVSPVSAVAPTPVPTAALPTAIPETATPAPVPATATPIPQRTEVTPTATRPAAIATATPATAQASADNTPDVLLNAERSVFKQKAVRVLTTLTEANGSVMNNTVEMIPPDRVHVIVANMETIAIRGIGVWQKTGGQWQKLPGGEVAANSILSAITPSQLDDLGVDIVYDKFQSLGTELLAGKPTRVYQYETRTTVGNTTSNGAGKIWIGVADGLPYKAEGSSGSGASLTKTTITYEYDASIKIEAPM